MASTSDHHPLPSFFPWDRLPISILETILSLLPISTLIVCKSVSHSWRSTIQSPTFTASYHPHSSSDLIFLLFSDTLNPTLAAAYHPFRDRWIHLPIPRGLTFALAAGKTLLLANLDKNHTSVLNPFAHGGTAHPLPPMDSIHHPYILAVIEESPSDYKIVVVSTLDRVYSQIYDSRSGQWEPRGELAGRFAVLSDGVYLDGLIFCLSRGPDHILTFDLAGGEWSILDVAMPLPSVVCCHILVFGGELFLTAGVEEVGVVVRIGIWKLNRSGMNWMEMEFMPGEYFGVFGAGDLRYFETVDGAGMICFYNRANEEVLMCDLAVRRWWRPRSCDVPKGRRMWFGHALEPHIDLVK